MDYQPRPTTSGDYYEFPYDFNKLGLWLEQAGKVKISTIGNAVIRSFRMRDLIDLVLTKYPVDQWIFFQVRAAVDLPFGQNATRDYVDEAGREDTAIWAVATRRKSVTEANGEFYSQNLGYQSDPDDDKIRLGQSRFKEKDT